MKTGELEKEIREITSRIEHNYALARAGGADKNLQALVEADAQLYFEKTGKYYQHAWD